MVHLISITATKDARASVSRLPSLPAQSLSQLALISNYIVEIRLLLKRFLSQGKIQVLPERLIRAIVWKASNK